MVAIKCERDTDVYCNGIVRGCPTGSYCPSLTIAHTCKMGTYCPHNSTIVSICPHGFYCPTPSNAIKCSSKQYCPANSTNASPCPTGYTCINGNKIQCPYGHLCNDGIIRACPHNSYCPNATTVEECPLYKFCPDNAVAYAECPDKHLCTNGKPIQCAPGEMCTDGQSRICPAGYFCADGTRRPCPENYYCPYGVSEPKKCKEGIEICEKLSAYPTPKKQHISIHAVIIMCLVIITILLSTIPGRDAQTSKDGDNNVDYAAGTDSFTNSSISTNSTFPNSNEAMAAIYTPNLSSNVLRYRF